MTTYIRLEADHPPPSEVFVKTSG